MVWSPFKKRGGREVPGLQEVPRTPEAAPAHSSGSIDRQFGDLEEALGMDQDPGTAVFSARKSMDQVRHGEFFMVPVGQEQSAQYWDEIYEELVREIGNTTYGSSEEAALNRIKDMVDGIRRGLKGGRTERIDISSVADAMNEAFPPGKMAA